MFLVMCAFVLLDSSLFSGKKKYKISTAWKLMFNSLRLLTVTSFSLHLTVTYNMHEIRQYYLWGLMFFQFIIVPFWILVDFTYPSLEESVPKPAAQMPPPPIEVDENIELINNKDERMGPLNISTPVEPIATSKSDVLPIIQPVPIVKNFPQVCS